MKPISKVFVLALGMAVDGLGCHGMECLRKMKRLLEIDIDMAFAWMLGENKYNDKLNNKLFEVTEKGHLDVVKLLVSVGANVNAKNEYKEVPLHLAAEKGHLDVVKFLYPSLIEIYDL